MMTQYEPLPGFLHYKGKRYTCPCGSYEFRVEIDTSPTRFWCECGAMYTEYVVDSMGMEHEEVISGQ